jgi:hypothetical protein
MQEEVDRWDGVWDWDSSSYSAQKVYKIISSSSHVPRTFIHLWHSKCHPKQKLFFWLVLQDRLNTKAMLKRRGMELDSYTCEITFYKKKKHGHTFLLNVDSREGAGI